MNKFLDILIPRFITEQVAGNYMEDGSFWPICNESDLDSNDAYDAIITVRTFNLFGFGLFPKFVDPK